jgi:prevent-host-death family protein
MMATVGIFDAKTRLSEIAERVKRTGEPVTVTKRGVPLVEIVPCRPPARMKRSREEIFAEIDAIRRQLPPITRAEIREAIDEGRR